MTGLMWYDASPEHSLAEKVRRATRQYKQKFNKAPNICHVHPSEFTVIPPGEMIAAQMLVGDVEVVPSPTTLRHHFLIGRKEDSVNDNANPTVNEA